MNDFTKQLIYKGSLIKIKELCEANYMSPKQAHEEIESHIQRIKIAFEELEENVQSMGDSGQ